VDGVNDPTGAPWPDVKRGSEIDLSLPRRCPDCAACRYAVKLLPQPQPPVALGLWKVKPEPCIDVT